MVSRPQNTPSSGESHEDSLKSRDEALLRQALEVMEGRMFGAFEQTIAALRERLGETK